MFAKDDNECSRRHCHVAECDGVLAGLVNAFPTALLKDVPDAALSSRERHLKARTDLKDEDSYRLNMIAVDPRFRRLGIASQLLRRRRRAGPGRRLRSREPACLGRQRIGARLLPGKRFRGSRAGRGGLASRSAARRRQHPDGASAHGRRRCGACARHRERSRVVGVTAADGRARAREISLALSQRQFKLA